MTLHGCNGRSELYPLQCSDAGQGLYNHSTGGSGASRLHGTKDSMFVIKLLTGRHFTAMQSRGRTRTLCGRRCSSTAQERFCSRSSSEQPRRKLKLAAPLQRASQKVPPQSAPLHRLRHVLVFQSTALSATCPLQQDSGGAFWKQELRNTKETSPVHAKVDEALREGFREPSSIEDTKVPLMHFRGCLV